MANSIKLFHEETNKGSYIQHIVVNGIELSGRSLKKSDDSENYNQLISFLNKKAQEELKKNPRFAWLDLSEWRSWANSYANEFLEEDMERQRELIRKSIEKANP